MEERDDDKSDERTDIFKSNSEVDSYDYDNEYYKSQRRKKDYVHVFVPEAEKKKSMRHVFICNV